MPACLILVCLAPAAPAHAQNQAVDDLKGRIFDARMAKQTFAGGLKFCNELDGKHFYFQARDRVLDLEEYHRSLENLAKQQVFNPEKHRPWTEQDAADRWDQVQKQAVSDQANCQLVASLPALEKQLDELEKNPPAPEKKNSPARARFARSGAARFDAGCCGRAFSATRKPAISCRERGNPDAILKRLEGAGLRATEAGRLRLRPRTR